MDNKGNHILWAFLHVIEGLDRNLYEYGVGTRLIAWWEMNDQR